MGEERRDFSRAPVPFDIRYHIYGELGESWRTLEGRAERRDVGMIGDK